MATTDFGAASALRVKEWSLTVTMQGRDDSFWFSNGFVSASTADQSQPGYIPRLSVKPAMAKGAVIFGQPSIISIPPIRTRRPRCASGLATLS